MIEQDPKSEEIIRPILRGRDIKRYSYDDANRWLINVHNGIKEKNIKPIEISDYPAIKKYLDQFLLELEKRADKGDTPYNLRNCAYMEEFYRQKIVWKAVGRNLTFSLLEEGSFLTAPASFITSEYNLYILGFLCSSYAKYYIYNSDTTGAGDIMLNIQSLEKIPIPLINSENKEKIDLLVNNIITSKMKRQDTSVFEKQLDSLIYKMFEFDSNEITFIESL